MVGYANRTTEEGGGGMSGKNDFLAKISAAKAVGFQAGLVSGRQQILDMMTLVLCDPEIMGSNILDKDSLPKVVEGIDEYIKKYELAWVKHNETDHVQSQLDKNLAEVYGEKLKDSFHVRYPYAPEYDYVKGKWI